MIEIIKDYAAKRVELLKIQIQEKSSLSAGTIVFVFLIAVVCSFFVLFFNFGIAFLIGESLDSDAYGFLIVAGFYLLLTIIVLLFKKLIIKSIANKLIGFLKK
ncbi:phage holin family protein [Chryseobacterium sp. SC28]|uniref:phage holin family protein n=1 Tax=Chryseobacterium sp. SC28 TaxID=2268028 RepID=UPI000F64DAF7|nr:phage holin family protein [Chryseobacterium sp. SC28]RRQ45260.1 hypothetical protein DTW91_11135 [Chryseobacterium sp. SC28]